MKSKWNTAIVTLVFAVMLIFVGGDCPKTRIIRFEKI